MVKYRPHRGGLAEAMAEAKEFETVEEMIKHICVEDDFFRIRPEDVIIGDPEGDDLRVNWMNVHIVSTKRINNTIYEPPAAIGFCSID